MNTEVQWVVAPRVFGSERGRGPCFVGWWEDVSVSGFGLSPFLQRDPV